MAVGLAVQGRARSGRVDVTAADAPGPRAVVVGAGSGVVDHADLLVGAFVLGPEEVFRVDDQPDAAVVPAAACADGRSRR